MLSYLVYGHAGEMQTAKSKLEAAFKINFEERRSFYWGRYFSYKAATSQLLLEVKENIDQLDGEVLEPQFSQYPILLYVVISAAEFETLDELPYEFSLLRKEIS